jgi:peroxiredoxin
MSEGTTKQESRFRNPIFIFVGFLLLGAALGLLLFGGDLFGSNDSSDSATVPGPAVLDQVGALPDTGSETNEGNSQNQIGGVLSVGDRAYNFTLEDLDGNLVSLADFQGKPVIVNFWATWCAPCRIEMPELQAAFEKHRDKELVILALDQDEPAEVASEYFYDEMGLTFTPLLDQNSAISTAYGSFGVLPSTYFVDPEGSVSAIHRGPLTQSQIDKYLADMLKSSS